ncbi:hypothetical protein B0A55_11807, partial [Friedmanniomyces simplex]
LLKLSEDVSVSRSYPVTRDGWETVRELIQRAMDEVRAIFREAKSRSEDDAGAACGLWGSVNLEYLFQSDKTPTPPTLLRASCLPIFLLLKVLPLQQSPLQ